MESTTPSVATGKDSWTRADSKAHKKKIGKNL